MLPSANLIFIAIFIIAYVLPGKFKKKAYCNITKIKKAYRPEPVRRNPDEGRDSEGDFAFSLGDACIERGFKEVDDLLDARGEAGGKDVAVRVIQPHGAVEIIGRDMEAIQFGASLHQLGSLLDDELEIFDLEDLLHHGHFLLWFRNRNDRLFGFNLQDRLFLFGLVFCRVKNRLYHGHFFGRWFSVTRLQCGVR